MFIRTEYGAYVDVIMAETYRDNNHGYIIKLYFSQDEFRYYNKKAYETQEEAQEVLDILIRNRVV